MPEPPRCYPASPAPMLEEHRCLAYAANVVVSLLEELRR